ncbi:MAG: hypothetical protein HYU67_11835 [Flavobacteriia bacterium]|nr:hypothetical protein [Flavobacteriia bacterium]
MLKVKFLKLDVSNNSLSEGLLVKTINISVEKIANELEKKLTNERCDSHPDFFQTIIVKADREKTVIIDKSTLCCDDFRNKKTIT